MSCVRVTETKGKDKEHGRGHQLIWNLARKTSSFSTQGSSGTLAKEVSMEAREPLNEG